VTVTAVQETIRSGRDDLESRAIAPAARGAAWRPSRELNLDLRSFILMAGRVSGVSWKRPMAANAIRFVVNFLTTFALFFFFRR
jgi:hypothetical protein